MDMLKETLANFASKKFAVALGSIIGLSYLELDSDMLEYIRIGAISLLTMTYMFVQGFIDKFKATNAVVKPLPSIDEQYLKAVAAQSARNDALKKVIEGQQKINDANQPQ